MMRDYALRSENETASERRFLERRIANVERDMGRLAARLGTPTPQAPELEVLDRARALFSDLHKQVRVRPLEDALGSRLDWLSRAAARRADGPDADPKPELGLIALDQRLLSDLLEQWHSEPGWLVAGDRKSVV